MQVLELSGIDIGSQGVSLPILNVEQMETAVGAFKKSLSHFVGLPEALTCITLKNSSEYCPSGSHTKGSVPIFKRSGKINITTDRYMNLIETFQPDFFSCLSDGDTFLDSSNKRVSKACERSSDLFRDCLERKKSSSMKGMFFMASVEGGFNEFERKKSIEFLKEHEPDIDGYFVDGFHRNAHEATSLTSSDIRGIVEQIVSLLPVDKMKMMLGAYSPSVLLELIRLGIDVFDTSFADIVTNVRRALVFNFDVDRDRPTEISPEIDLMDSKFKEDFAPLVEGCECYACRKHTRAYVNHLLLTRELLGPALLSLHNTYHLLKFFEKIREAIKNEKLVTLTTLIGDQYNAIGGKLIYKTEEKKIIKNETK